MNEAHDYDTVKVKVSALNGTHVIVGECGGLSAVFDACPSTTLPGYYAVATEHGTSYFSEHDMFDVLAPEREPENVDIESFVDVSAHSIAVAFEQDIYDNILAVRSDLEAANDCSLNIKDRPFTITSVETDSEVNWIRINFTAHYMEDN
jgi:hypothetical protein